MQGEVEPGRQLIQQSWTSADVCSSCQQPFSDTLVKVISYAFSSSECILFCVIFQCNLPRWLRWLRHSVDRPGRSIGVAGVQFPGSAGRFYVQISGAHALRLISRAGKQCSTVSSIICDRWLILN